MVSPDLAPSPEVFRAPYQPSELEAVARLLLRDRPIRVVPGPWWSYFPERNEVVYPSNLLSEWPAPRSLGALCHEIAEVLYSGPDAVPVVRSFTEAATRAGCASESALLLFNVLNDLRVNRSYIDAFPGSRRYFAAVYETLSLVLKDDLKNQGKRSAPLPHHVFLDSITRRWAIEFLHTARVDTKPSDERVRRALSTSWVAVVRAIAADDLTEFSLIVQADVLPAYGALVQASVEALRRASDQPETDSDEPPRMEEDGEEAALLPDDLRSLVRGSPADESPAVSWVLLASEDDQPTEDEGPRPIRPVPTAPNGETRPPSVVSGTRWTGGVVQKFRRLGRRSQMVSAYEEFNYVEAVRRLQPQIDALLQGSPSRDGLIAILNRRRFGTLDPFRRPRRRRRGDSGDIDADHPEHLRLAPSIAFLKGQRQARDDSQKDFAHAILLDVSGSIVQKGYRSRKFDQLIDTFVIFCEIHQRLKLPIELIVFSDRCTVARPFDETRYDNLSIAPNSSYVIRDFSYVVRDMYRADHGETHETPALDRAIADLSSERGLKTIFVVTDGISSDRTLLTERLLEIEHRNQYLPPRERLMLLAFGLGLAENEFNQSYQPESDGQPIQCSSGKLVPNLESLATIVCDAVDLRIRTA